MAIEISLRALSSLALEFDPLMVFIYPLLTTVILC